MGTAVPAALVEPIENATTAFATLSDAIKTVCGLYDTDSQKLAESNEMGNKDILLGNLCLIFSFPP